MGAQSEANPESMMRTTKWQWRLLVVYAVLVGLVVLFPPFVFIGYYQYVPLGRAFFFSNPQVLRNSDYHGVLDAGRYLSKLRAPSQMGLLRVSCGLSLQRTQDGNPELPGEGCHRSP